MQGTCFTSQHWEKEDGTYNSMESYVHSYKKVRKTQHTHKPGNAFKTTTLPSTGVIYSKCSVSTVLNFLVACNVTLLERKVKVSKFWNKMHL